MDLREELFALEEQLLLRAVRQNTAMVAGMLSDEFLEFGSSGRMYTKPEILESLQAEAPKELSLRDLKLTTLSPDVALLTYKVRKLQADVPAVESLRSSIWSRQAGRWQMIFHQGTAIAAAAG